MALSKHTMQEIMSEKALVCRREINGETGGAIVYSVMLADGFLLECGNSYLAEKRATILAAIINDVGPELFSKDGLKDCEVRK